MDRTGVLAEAEPQLHLYTYRLEVACWHNDHPRVGRLDYTVDGFTLAQVMFHPDLLLVDVETNALREALSYIEHIGATPVLRHGEWLRDVFNFKNYDEEGNLRVTP